MSVLVVRAAPVSNIILLRTAEGFKRGEFSKINSIKAQCKTCPLKVERSSASSTLCGNPVLSNPSLTSLASLNVHNDFFQSILELIISFTIIRNNLCKKLPDMMIFAKALNVFLDAVIGGPALVSQQTKQVFPSDFDAAGSNVGHSKGKNAG